MMLSLSDGRLAYAYTGGKPLDTNLPTIVMIHGAQNDHSVWILQSRYLAHHGYGVLAVDLPGHGRSPGPPLESVEAMASWILDVIDAAGVKQVALAGHSMGSLISTAACAMAETRAASHDSPQIRALALLGSAYPMKVSDMLLDATRNDEAQAISMINLWSFSRLNHRPGAPGPGFSLFVQARRLMERQAQGVLAIDFAACNNYSAGTEHAALVKQPVQFILGAQDAMTPAKAGRNFAQLFAQAQVAVIEQCGHQLLGERPEHCLDHLRTFFARVFK
jgi:pimeloyl-ACP methyl ester carboxylesterase